jgi:hypothetical protein
MVFEYAVPSSPTWSGLIGKPMGWGWLVVNQQGYLDSVLLSFGGVVPEVAIIVVASALKLRRVSLTDTEVNSC